MKKILIFIMIISSTIIESTNNSKDDRTSKQIEIEMAKEQKYAKEQTFYNEANYDFKGSEVHPDTVKRLKEIEVDELDMDSVYD